MADSTLNRFLARGTNAQRIAFTPTPPTPASGPSPTYVWFETDTGDTYAYDGAAWVKIGSALGGVAGPGSATDNAIARFDGTTGKLIQNSAVTIADTTGLMAGARFGNTGLKVEDTNASHLLTIAPGSDLTADRTLTLTTGDANRSLTLPLVKTIGIVIDGGGAAIATGIKGDISVPQACTITSVRMLADQSGSIVVDIWKDTYANYPPTVADTITASAKPTISAAVKSEDTTLTGWTTAIAAGDTLRFNVDSAATIQRVTLQLTVTVP